MDRRNFLRVAGVSSLVAATGKAEAAEKRPMYVNGKKSDRCLRVSLLPKSDQPGYENIFEMVEVPSSEESKRIATEAGLDPENSREYELQVREVQIDKIGRFTNDDRDRSALEALLSIFGS